MQPTKSKEKSQKTGGVSSLRFDFSGKPIKKEIAADIPTHQGLHHHGLDPEEPGYTINELFILTRSNVPAQRVIGLQVPKSQTVEVYIISCSDSIS